jgi:hypothetical protein
MSHDFSFVHAKCAIQDCVAVVCSDIIRTQTPPTPGRHILMLLKPLRLEKEGNDSALLCCSPASKGTSLMTEGYQVSPIYPCVDSSFKDKVCVWSIDRMILTEEREALEGKIVPLPLCPPQIPYGLTWD